MFKEKKRVEKWKKKHSGLFVLARKLKYTKLKYRFKHNKHTCENTTLLHHSKE